ncbi:hypothetical protein PPTG_22692 [Phytophthora nicotianae INRA-310]|uniref:Uncharacterized protein n=1 Tax=Phytophthora nicotianae (strain INRA-310) TaxID=761204 RepID=W2QEN2_PHYN3|nr:hypothetical protein PPTG_22692 [Phytophthora nicotianae INRA-310]ETN10735.1 hypothetical protein PPTG_22692 [Phytophthora nicotianae INRA-310]
MSGLKSAIVEGLSSVKSPASAAIKSVDNFNMNSIESIQLYIMRLQKSDNITEYESTLSLIDEKFTAPRQRKQNDGTVEYQIVAEYLRRIHPTTWTNFGIYMRRSVEVTFFSNNWEQSDAF